MSSEDATMNLILQNFDPDAFLGVEYEEALDTSRTLLPQGEVPVDTIQDFEIIKPRLFTDQATGQQNWSSPVLSLKLLIDDSNIREALNVDEERELINTQRLYLDLSPEGLLDFGPNRNIQLGQLRAALGQNNPGEPWSFSMLRGSSPFIMVIAHQPSKNNPEVFFEKVTRFAPAPQEE